MGFWESITSFFSDTSVGCIQNCPIDKRLDQASWLSRDNTAREIIKELSDSDVASLPTQDKARLAEELTSGYFSDEDETALNKLFKDTTQIDYQPASDLEKQRKFSIAINLDEEIRAAKNDWANLSQNDREKALQRVADIHADSYGIPQKELLFEDLGDMNSFGYYSSNQDRVVISDHVDENGKSILDDYSEAFDTVAHENTHRYQNSTIKKLDDEAISKDDDIYNQARLIRVNQNHYVSPKSDYAAYRNQPMEAHAWGVGSSAR